MDDTRKPLTVPAKEKRPGYPAALVVN